MARAVVLVPWFRYPPFRESGIGGLSVAVWELTRAMARAGADVEVLVKPSGPEGQSEADGVTVTRSDLGSRIESNQKLGHKDVRLLVDNYDAILSIANFGAVSLTSSRELLLQVKRQVHMVAHDRPLSSYLSLKPSFFEYPRAFVQKRREERRESELSGVGTVCVSEYLARRMVETSLEHPKNVKVVPNGVDIRSFKPTGVRKQFDLLYVGRFQRIKGLDILLRAASLARREMAVEMSIGVVGEFTDSQVSYLGSRTDPSVRASVKYIGKVERDKMPEMINCSRFLVIPSRYESFGLPALESIACGVPVIASPVGGLPELVEAGLGTLAASSEPASLASAIVSSMKDATLEQSALEKGPVKAESYSWDVLAPKAIEFMTTTR